MRQKLLPGFRTIVLLAIVLLLCGSGKSEVKQLGWPGWPGWRGSNGDGVSLETDWDPSALSGGAKILWRADVGTGYSNVAIAANLLYTMGQKDKGIHLQCLDAESGQELWRHSFERGFTEPRSTPAVDGNDVYALDADGTLVCLDATDGKLRWQKHLESDFGAEKTMHGWVSSPVAEGDLLLINANTRHIAVNKKNGKEVWRFEDEVPYGSWGSYATAAVADLGGSKIALFLGPSRLSAVEVKTGRKLWSVGHDDVYHPAADPIQSGRNMFISLSTECSLLRLTRSTPKEVWRTQELNTFISTAVLVDGYLFGPHTPTNYWPSSWGGIRHLEWPVRCVDVSTGEVVWEQRMGYVSLCAAAGKLIVLELDGTLHIVEATPTSYKEISKASVAREGNRSKIYATPPVLCDGRIYCREYLGDLVCVDVSER